MWWTHIHTEVARLRRRFPFVLQHALSFRTRHHLCRQGVSLTSATRAQERDRGTAVGNFDLQQQVVSPTQEACKNRGIDINAMIEGRIGEGVARGTVNENKRCNDSVEVDEIEVVGRKHRDSVSPLSRLIRSCRHSSNHWSPVGRIHYYCSIGRFIWQGRLARLCAI